MWTETERGFFYMKKWISAVLTLLCLIMTGAACAKTYELECGSNGYFVCEDFQSEMPKMAEEIFGGFVREGDEMLCGTLFEEHYRNSPGKVNRGGALMAVKREGKILLMSANGDEGRWNAGIETDSFLPPDAQFSVTTTGGENVYAHLTILYRDGAYEMRTLGNGGAYLYAYSWTDEMGKALHMDCENGKFSLREEGDWPYTILAEGRAMPDRLAAWTADTLPKDTAGIRAFEETYPIKLNDDEAYITSVNLRERATGQSDTWGKYTAKVQILDQKSGNSAPWFRVRVGNLEGWVSGVYVHGLNDRDQWSVYSASVMIHPVGRMKTETMLWRMPGGEAAMQLPADTYVHVLGERDGWLHVIVPNGELTWRTDWDGTYGFVKAEDMAVGISKVDAMHKAQ